MKRERMEGSWEDTGYKRQVGSRSSHRAKVGVICECHVSGMLRSFEPRPTLECRDRQRRPSFSEIEVHSQ